MRVGYARVSTSDQRLDLQRDALLQSGCTKIFEAVARGVTAERAALNAALEYVRPDDTLVVWRLDRLGRSLRHLMHVVHTLHERGVGFQSLVEASDTTPPPGQFFLHVTGAFAELERHLIRERTMAGLASARQRGHYGGRPQAIAPETFAMALQLYEARTTSVERICTRLGMARRSFYRYLAAHQGGYEPKGRRP
jgi:DNA invertase Pin-like site-specific DNA recombinase